MIPPWYQNISSRPQTPASSHFLRPAGVAEPGNVLIFYSRNWWKPPAQLIRRLIAEHEARAATREKKRKKSRQKATADGYQMPLLMPQPKTGTGKRQVAAGAQYVPVNSIDEQDYLEYLRYEGAV